MREIRENYIPSSQIENCIGLIRRTIDDLKSEPSEVFKVEPIFWNPLRIPTTGSTESFKAPAIEKFLEGYDANINIVHHKSWLITVNFDTSISYILAWQRVKYLLDQTVENLSKSDIPYHLICSTIEHTHQIPKKHAKEKKGEGLQWDEIYKVKNFGDLEKLAAKKQTVLFLDNINVGRYTENLLNIITELIYTNNDHSRDSQFMDYLYERQQFLMPFVDQGLHRDGRNHPFKFKEERNSTGYITLKYEMNLELFLAHTQETLGPTTMGYPHIHISMLCDFSQSYIEMERKIEDIIRHSTGLCDIRVDRHKHDPPYPTASMMYVFKNHSSKQVNESLLRYYNPKPTPIVSCYIPLHSLYANDLFNILIQISHKSDIDKFSSNTNSYNKTISMAIYGIKTPNIVKQSELLTMPVPINTFTLVDPELNKGKNRYLHAIQNYMLHENLIICEGMIYKKVDGSKTSFQPNTSIKSFMLAFSKNLGYDTREEKKIQDWMENPEKLKQYDPTIQYADFPRGEINYRLIELGDFYFSFVTRSIYKTQNKYLTYFYCPLITLANLDGEINKIIEKSNWIETLIASRVYTIDDIATLYKCILNRKDDKNATVSIVGPSNTGKTTMIKPFKYIFPSHLVGELQEFSEHHVADLIKGKLMIIINEANTFLQGVESKLKGHVLLICEGGTGVSNKKMGEITNLPFSYASMVLSSNILSGDAAVYRNAPLMNRLQICLTHTNLNDIQVNSYIDEASKYEAPGIILFSAMCNLAKIYNLDYVPKLPIYDTLDNFDLEKIELSNKFESEVKVVYIPGTELTKYSTKLGDNTVITLKNLIPFTHAQLPLFSDVTQSEKICFIKREIADARSTALESDVTERKLVTNKVNAKYPSQFNPMASTASSIPPLPTNYFSTTNSSPNYSPVSNSLSQSSFQTTKMY